jgi:hypothetical protein
MAIQTIVSGTGFSGLIPYNDSSVGTDVQGSPSDIGFTKKAIARWTEPPSSLYRENKVVGLMAFHADGIKEVDFVLNGGATITVDTPQFNSETGFNEYCVRLDKDDIVGTLGEGFHNVELRAIVKPKIGIPRVLQHDVAGISGEEFAKMLDAFGISGGHADNTAGPSGDGYLFPGEYSFVGTMLKSNTDSSMKDIEIFMSPSGNDTNTGLTRSAPLKTIGKALEVMRDQFKADPNPFSTADDNDQFVDRGIITFLAGEYSEENYNITANQSFKLQNHYTHLVLRGDPDPAVDVRDIHFITNDPDLPLENLGINIGNKQLSLSLLKFEKIFFDLTSPKRWDQNTIGITRARNDRRDTIAVDNTKIAPCPYTWMDKCHVVSLQYSSRGYLDFMGSVTNDSLGGPMATECYFEGGSSLSKGLKGLVRNVTVHRQGEDQTFGASPIIGLYSSECQPATAIARRIDFYDEDNPSQPHPEYGKFNGWYLTQQTYDWIQRTDSDAEEGYLDVSGNNPLNFNMVENPNLGTLMRKINEDAWLGNLSGTKRAAMPTVCTPLNEDIITIPDDFFVKRDEPDSTKSPIEDRISYRRGSIQVDAGLYQKGSITVWDKDWHNTYFENKYMACLFCDDIGSGVSAAGYALFDADRPLDFGNGLNQQRYLWRQAGTTAMPSGGRAVRAVEASTYGRGTALTEEHRYGWSEGPTNIKCPQFGNSDPSVTNAANGGSTTDSHNIEGIIINGSEDGEHGDFIQYYVNGNAVDTNYPRLENLIVAYNRGDNFPSQYSQQEGKGTFMYSRDIAYVNNIFNSSVGTRRHTDSRSNSSQGMGIAQQNLLYEHNTNINNPPAFGDVGGHTLEGFAGEDIPIHSGGFCIRNNITDGFLNNTFTKDTGAAWNAGTDSTTDSRFKVVDTICEANYHYEHRDTYPGPGQINGFLYDQVRGSTGQVMVAASRKFGIDYPAYTLKTSLFPPVEEGIAAPGYISTYTIKPIGDNGIISPLIGGATNTSVYDDYNRVPRAGRATVGAVEYNSYADTFTQLGDPTTNTTFTLADVNITDNESVYGKKIYVKAFKDGEELKSTNGVVFGNYYTYAENNDPTTEDQSDGIAETHEVIEASQNGVVGRYPGADNDVFLNPADDDFTPLVNDWLLADYGLYRMTLYTTGYGTASFHNYVNLQFVNVVAKNRWETASDASSQDIVFTFPDGATAALDIATKSQGTGNAETVAKSLKYYLIDDANGGITFGLTFEAGTNNFWEGLVNISKPTDM